MYETVIVKTRKREELIDVSETIRTVVKKSDIKNGVCILSVPHASAAITINEGSDKNVLDDILEALRKIAPKGTWKHDKIDDNADAHIKSSFIGTSTIVPIRDNMLLLGRWQTILFCEFDGPRERTIMVNLLADK